MIWLKKAEHYKAWTIFFIYKNGQRRFNVWQDWNWKKKRFYGHKTSIFWGDVNIQKVLVSNKISFGEKIVRTLLVTCTMVIKLNH